MLRAPHLLALLLAVFMPSAWAACGYVNGQYVCTETPGCGTVNGTQTCALPKGCGYVNAIYTCTLDQANSPAKPGVVNPKAGGGNKPDAGPVAGLEWLANFFAGKGADDWLSSAMAWMVERLVLSWLEMKLWAMELAWSVAKSILEGAGLFTQIASSFAALPADVLGGLNLLGIPAAINMILTAIMTRFVLNFVPGA